MRSAQAVEGEFFTFNNSRGLATTATAKRNSFLYSFFALATLFIFVLISAVPAKAGNASPFDQSVIDDAMGVSMVAFGTGDSPSVVKSAQAFYFLSLVAHFDPNATSSSGASVASHVLAFFRFYVAGGHEPACSNPLYGWGDGPVGQGLLMIKNTPALWNALTSTEQGKSDLLISAEAIAGNWAFNDQNNFTTGLGGGGNFKKTNNPNFVQSYIGIELACSIYFGGASGCNNVFTTFDFNTFMGRLSNAGFTNITSAWNVTGATAMNAAVKAPFVYNGVTLSDPNGIFYQEAVNLPNAMYNGTSVSNTGCSGAAHIVSGSSPELNQLGQAHEFASTDSSGCRSDALYVYEGWMGSIEGRTALKVFNLWGAAGSNATQVAASNTQMLVGSTDLVYKLHQGYVGVSYLGTRTITDGATDQPAGKGYLYIHNIWDKLINVNNAPPPDFSLAATPASLTAIQGNSASYTATTTALNSFNGVVALGMSGLPSGTTFSFNPTSVTGAGSSTLTVTTSSSTPAGTYTLTITGTSGSSSHSATVTLVVNLPPDFSLAATPASQTVIQGNNTSYTATVGALNGFTGTVSLSSSGLPAGASASFSPASVNGSGNSTLNVTTSTSTPAGSYTVTITGTSGSLSHSATVTLTINPIPPDFSLAASPSSQSVIVGNGASYTATVGALYGYTGTVSLSVGGLPAGATAGFSPASVSGSGSSVLSVSTTGSTPTGSYPLTITGTDGTLTHSASVTLVVSPPPDFSLSATPASQTVFVGSGTSYTASVGAINGFTGSVSLSASGLPTGTSASFSPASVSGSGNSTLSVSTSGSTPTGSYTITITGTSGSLTHSTTVTLAVNPAPDFSLSATPASQTVLAGGGTSYTASVGAINGFAGTVSLSASGLPAGASASFSPTSVSGSGSSTVSVSTSGSTPTGSYTVTITGTSGSLTHSATLTLVVNPVPNFSLAMSPASQTITVGGNTTYTTTVTALNGFSGNVSLSASGLPTGASASFNPASVSGSGTSTVTVSTTTSTPAGSYTLTITGTSGALTHSATVTLVVNSACITTGATWVNTALPVSETGTFTVAYDATPSTSTNNSVVALSKGVQTAYTGFANLARFYTNSDIDARNGGAYQAQSVIPYSAGKSYHFRMVINVPAHTYSIYVTPPGGSELTVGLNWAFRTEQNTVTSLDHWGVYSEVGSTTVCNFGVQ